jgi:hypothetical protein
MTMDCNDDVYKLQKTMIYNRMETYTIKCITMSTIAIAMAMELNGLPSQIKFAMAISYNDNE